MGDRMGKPPHPAFYDGSMERNRGGRPRHPDVLTPAEWRVLEALREGGTNAEIAARLGVSANTVRYHVSNMLAKLELRDRRALAAWRPDTPRRRLGGLFALPAAVWSVGRPLAWVGVGAAALAGLAVVVVALVALEVIVEGDPDPAAAVAPPPVTPTPTSTPTTTPVPTPTAASPTPSAMPEPSPVSTPPAAPSPTPTPTATPDPLPTATATPTSESPTSASAQSGVPTHPRLPSTPTFDTPPGTYTAIAVGAEYFAGLADHACALHESGEVVCWAIDSGAVWDAPVGSYSFIAAVDGAMCAAPVDGDMMCWTSRGSVARDAFDPSRDAPPGRYTAISGESGYYCALTDEGEPLCWGPQTGPLPLPALPPGSYTTISLDYSIFEESGNREAHLTACALSSADSLVCWRAFNSRDVHDDVATGQSVEHIPGNHAAAHVYQVEVCTVTADGMANCEDWNGDGASRYTSLALGGEFVCAITETGTIQCGRHDIQGLYFGEWGSRGLMDAPGPGAGHRYTAVSVGYAHACALTDLGEAVCWGSVQNRLTNPDPPPDGYVAVTDGYGHTCALTADGLAACWGWNNFGQADVPDGRYTAISAGFATTCALSEGGEPVCWGTLSSGAFPEGSYRAISTGYDAACALTGAGRPVCIGDWGLAGADAPPGPFVAITVGWTGHACALSEDGDVTCWGGRQLRAELDVPFGTWTAVAAGDLQTCAIAAEGELVCWGARPAQLADAPSERYVAVDTNGYDICVLTDAAQMLCGTAYDLVLSPTSEDRRVSRISVGLNRTCAVTEEGAVVCWGDTEYWYEPAMNRHGYQPRYP